MGFRMKTMECAFLVAFLIASSGSIPVSENETQADRMMRYRLPNDTIPRFYNVHLEPNMDDERLRWTGKTSIDVEVVSPTRLLTLHAYKNLVIDEGFTVLVDVNGTNVSPVEQSRDDDVELLRVKFDHEIPRGNYSLRLKFEGAETGELTGFYKGSWKGGDAMFQPYHHSSFYNNHGSTTLVGNVAATHFEATTARRAFPCWDEPGLKAAFRVSVKHFPNYTTVSNMPEIERAVTPDGKILTTFDTTPIMSTYLLTFVIADYRSVFNEHRNVTLHTSNDTLESMRHLLDLSPKVVRVMESYTGLPYGFPRIGSVVVPRYSAAATEHWGLVTYFEKAIAIEKMDPIWNVDRVEMLVAHELSHSWFGNRVTPLWWDDLWLNEAFAAYFQYYIMDEIYDNWRGVEFFILRNNLEVAFSSDDGSYIPIKWTPVTNTEIRRLFGPMTYRKGSAIVHMFRNVLGDVAFRAGLQKYLTRHSFKAATAEDLIDALQEAHNEGPNKESPLDLEKAMMSWLVQTGHPIVNVTRNYTTGATEVSQKSNIMDSPNKWWIPLNYATKSRPNFTSTLPTRWISDKEERIEIDGIDKDDWIILNIQASGFYRVNYDDENWNRLADYLNTDDYHKIHVLNRAQLIGDAFNLAEHEPKRYLRIFYKLTKYLSREDEYLPWRSVHNAIKRIEWSLRNTEVLSVFERHFVDLMQKFIEKVGFAVRDTDDHFAKLSRTDVIAWACSARHSGCAEYAASKLIQLAENPEEVKVHPNEKSWIFCSGMRGLNETAGKQFVNWALEHKKDEITRSIACTENHEVHKVILNKFLMGNDPEAHRMTPVFYQLLSSTERNFNNTVDFFLENHRAMNNTGVTDLASQIVTDMFYAVSNRARLEKFKAVLQLDAVVGDSQISTTKMLTDAEERVTERDNNDAPVSVKQWDKLLSGDNSISGSRIET